MEIQPGVVFGRYTIEAELGRGGMGRVVLAVDGVLHRKVALKLLLPDGLLAKEEVVARFFREARLAAQLNHPNVVHIYDLGEGSGISFIAMEYVDGKPLTAYLGDASVPPERRMRWLVDVARGLGAAHARGLLHRDMKPANVMVSREGVAKVVDFGLAKKEPDARASSRSSSVPPSNGAAPRVTFQTAEGFVIGTPAYMAPEQLEGLDVDARADQFGWALTAYALMLGQNLRKDDPLLFGPIPLLSDKVPSVPRRVAEIVLRALSNDREMRFPSIDLLLAELEPAVLAMPATSPGASTPPLDPAPVSQQITPVITFPMNARRFCPDCGLPLGMSSPRCGGQHAPAFPKPPGTPDEPTE
jgi:serine/threonine protein kinase